MPDMLQRFLDSTKPRVLEAKEIPNKAVNFFDQNSTFQDGFTPFEKKGDVTHFTDDAQQYYNEEVKIIATPPSFQPTEPGIPIHRYTPEKGYYDPGKGK